MKNYRNAAITAALILGLVVGNLFAEPSKNFKVFLCFGQSNMSGGSGVTPNKTEDTQTNPRIFTLGFGNCQGWTNNNWALAKEPLHCGDNINAMGPAFAFGRVMADSLKDDTIALIPCGLYGRPLECWLKDGNNMGSGGPIPGFTSGANVYNWMLDKCKTAQKRGVIAGIVMHQGESNNGDGVAYLSKIKKLYNNLKTDLGLEHDIPYVAGELRQDATAIAKNGNNTKFNDVLSHISDSLLFGYVASSKGCGEYNNDQWLLHFNQAGYRTMGQRMAVEMLKGLKAANAIPAVDQPHSKSGRVVSAASVNSARDNVNFYSLSGKLVSTGSAMTSAARTSIKPGNIYVVVNKTTGTSANLMIAPTAR